MIKISEDLVDYKMTNKEDQQNPSFFSKYIKSTSDTEKIYI